MKKILAILLSITFVLSLTACGANHEKMLSDANDGANHEKMLSDAIELNWKEVYDEYLANEARAKNEYDGKIVKWTATVYDINEDYVTMANETYAGLPANSISVYLSKEELMELEDFQEITVVGKLSLWTFSTIKEAFIVK